jgi:hypothetical protein
MYNKHNNRLRDAMTTFYIKEGKRYKAVSEYDSEHMSALPYGSHLIVVQQGLTNYRYYVEPALAPMIAAGEFAKQDMATAIVKASEARPRETQLTPQQMEAYNQFKQAYGDDIFYIQYPSANESVKAGIDAMKAEAEKLLKHPAVKKAYDNFMLIAKLAYDNKEV